MGHTKSAGLDKELVEHFNLTPFTRFVLTKPEHLFTVMAVPYWLKIFY
jgi:hypothetical protein